jgi:hypothetical protein
MDQPQIEPTRVRNPIDFDKAGRQAGYLHAPAIRSPW